MVPSAASAAPPARLDEPKLDRTLRVTALGFELLAPGVLANDGLELNANAAFGKEHLAVELKVAAAPRDIETMLARGGADPAGGDVASLPLAEFAAGYPRLSRSHC